jgi:GxxExxY protein
VLKEIKNIAKDLYNELGEGYDECIYHKAFEVGLRLSNINYESKSIVPVSYKGYNVGEQEIDLIIRIPESKMIVEFKAIPELLEDDKAQLHRYMRLLKADNGLLINFTQCGRAKKKDYSKLYTSTDLEPEYYSIGGTS